MEVTIHTHNVDLSPRLEDYIDKKVSKLDRYLPGIEEARIDLSTERAYPVAQLTIRHRRGRILRAEDKKQKDLFAAIDAVMDKMYRQIRSFKGKRIRRGGGVDEELFANAEPVPLPELTEAEEELEPKMEIARRKAIALEPIDEFEAIERMEAVGHPFYLFLNASTGKISVLYRREEGNYGVLEPVD